MKHPTGVVTGTFAGTDLHAVYALQLGEISAPHIPALAELPDVGPHATGFGKVVANLNLPFELRSYGWQLQRGNRVSAKDHLRAISHRDSTVQALADVAQDAAVPEVSVRLLGPVSMMSAGWLPSGQRILRDPGARQDVAAAWADGVATVTARIHDVVGAKPTIFIYEHDAAGAVDGTVRTASGAGVERSLQLSEVRDIWRAATDQEATMLVETSSQLVPTAAEVGGVALDWPQGRTSATERTWQLVDGLLNSETTVGLYIPHRENPELYAEELVQQYVDWGLDPKHLEYVRFVRRFAAESEAETGRGLQWLRVLADHAAGYASTL